MSLSPGQRIGPYDVVASIGAGGMGEVFRAHDPRLKRDVALKVLPAAAVSDPQRRSRFDREAQVLASLNHPAIAQVFGVEMNGDAPVIVMELVDGDTLADRLRRGALPIDETLAIARQLSDGLEAAHERHVVHRDLKPANIKIRPDGTIKILDFGIARVLANDAAVDTANSPTYLGGTTDAGMILGTAAYMSPEQARGRPVDKRADIWAFGCIVFELLAGTPVFSGESATDILAQVVQAEPAWDRLPPNTPERVVALLKRCLQKQPKDRLRDIGDARYELTRPDASAVAAAPRAPSPATGWTRSLAWMAGGAAITAALIIGVQSLGRVPADVPAAIRATVALPPATTLALGRGSSVTLSPDGRTLIYAARSQNKTMLYARPLDRFEAEPLPGTDEATNPFFSPDGRWVGFFANEKLKKVSLDGGAPVTVADALNPRGEAWGADDTIYVTVSNNAAISSVPARGGKLEAVTKLDTGELSHRWPSLLPDGKTLLFSMWNDAGWEVSRVFAIDRTGAKRPVVEAGGGYPRYVRDAGERGFLVYARSEGLLAAAFDERTLTVNGQSVPVVDGVLSNLSGGAHFDVSASGTLAYVPGEFEERNRDLVWVGRDGKTLDAPLTIAGLTRTWSGPHDGTRIVRNNAAGGGDVWVESLTGGVSTRITSRPELGNFNGILSPDGQWVVFARGFGQTVDLYRRPADGRDLEQRLTTSTRSKSPTAVSADGRWLAFFEVDPVTLSDIWVIELPAAGSTEVPTPRPFVKTNANDGDAAFSPDGKWVAYQSNESGRYEIYVRGFPDAPSATRISTESGVSPVWSTRGDELTFRSLAGRMMSAARRPDGSFDRPRELFDASRYETRYGVSPDGQRFLMMPLITSEQSATHINVVFNFLSELRQRVR